MTKAKYLDSIKENPFHLKKLKELLETDEIRVKLNGHYFTEALRNVPYTFERIILAAFLINNDIIIPELSNLDIPLQDLKDVLAEMSMDLTNSRVISVSGIIEHWNAGYRKYSKEIAKLFSLLGTDVYKLKNDEHLLINPDSSLKDFLADHYPGSSGLWIEKYDPQLLRYKL